MQVVFLYILGLYHISMILASNSWGMYIFHKDGNHTTIGLVSCTLLFHVMVSLCISQQPKGSVFVLQSKWLDSINNYIVFHQYTHQCKYHKHIMFDHISMQSAHSMQSHL